MSVVSSSSPIICDLGEHRSLKTPTADLRRLEEKNLWWNWYCNRDQILIESVPIPKLSLDEKISFIDPSFNEIAKTMPENHATWLKWYKFGNLNKTIFAYDTEPEVSLSFTQKRELLEKDRVRQQDAVCLLLNDDKFVTPYEGEELAIRLQVKADMLRESQKKRNLFPNRDGFLLGRYKYISYRIDNNHKELLHPEYIVSKIKYRLYMIAHPENAFTYDEYIYHINYQDACEQFKRAYVKTADGDSDSDEDEDTISLTEEEVGEADDDDDDDDDDE
jgi:hypothetical protein